MTVPDRKREAQRLYRDYQIYEAYKCAWDLPLVEFVSWFVLKSTDKKTKPNTIFKNPYFFSDFLVKQPLEWLNSEYAVDLWEYYLFQKEVSTEFENLVAHNKPQLFIEGYKKKLQFLNKKRLDNLKIKELPSLIQEEFAIWLRLNNDLDLLWDKVEHSYNQFSLPDWDVFIRCCSSFEQFVFEDPKDKSRWYYAGETLSLILAFCQFKVDFSNSSATAFNLNKSFFENTTNDLTAVLFKQTYNYVMFKYDVLKYAYEPGLKVTFEGNELRFCESESFNEQWHHDEMRYTVNEQAYYRYGEMIWEQLKDTGKINFINHNKECYNQLGNARKLAIKQAVRDLGLKDEDLKNNKLPGLETIISFLHGIAWRKLRTFEKPLHELANKNKYSYAEALAIVFKREKVLQPILISKTSILYDALIGSGISCELSKLNQLISNFSYRWKTKKFNPFKVYSSLWRKPFVEIGGNLISPISILTGFTGLYTITESILKNFGPREGKRIENILVDRFKNQPWNVYIPQSDNTKGDVDVIMEDDTHLLYIQLKRTSQKIDMLDMHNQLKQDLKAFQQLNDSAKRYDGKKELHLWYVTTAFEKVGTFENEIFRASYQDILVIKRLLDEDGLRFNSLAGFIEIVETDNYYNEARNHLI